MSRRPPAPPPAPLGHSSNSLEAVRPAVAGPNPRHSLRSADQQPASAGRGPSFDLPGASRLVRASICQHVHLFLCLASRSSSRLHARRAWGRLEYGSGASVRSLMQSHQPPALCASSDPSTLPASIPHVLEAYPIQPRLALGAVEPISAFNRGSARSAPPQRLTPAPRPPRRTGRCWRARARPA